MHKSESINELAKALALAQQEMKAAKKDAANPFFKSHYSTLASVSEACLPALNKQGLSVVQTTSVLESATVLITSLIHSSGQWISSTYPLHPTKNDPQSLGSCLSYARRYSLAAITGVVTTDDDAEHAMDRGVTPQANKTQRAPSYQPPHKATPEGSGALTAKQLQLIHYIRDKNNIKEPDYIRIVKEVGGVDSDNKIPFAKVSDVLGALGGTNAGK